MISEELLSEVLGFKSFVHEDFCYDNIIYPLVNHGFSKGIEQISNSVQYSKGINIYELANKCKEWAVKQGYTLESGLTWCNYYTNKDFTNDRTYLDYVVADTEPEAIFKACEWIMEQIK